MELMEFVKSEIKKQCEEFAAKYETTIVELIFGDEIEIFWNEPTLEFSFRNGYVLFADGDKRPNGTQFTCAFKTPKGYISNKKIGVDVKDNANVTFEEAAKLLTFNTDAIKNNFDPFWHENEARRRNAAAWNFIASNYLQDDCR